MDKLEPWSASPASLACITKQRRIAEGISSFEGSAVFLLGLSDRRFLLLVIQDFNLASARPSWNLAGPVALRRTSLSPLSACYVWSPLSVEYPQKGLPYVLNKPTWVNYIFFCRLPLSNLYTDLKLFDSVCCFCCILDDLICLVLQTFAEHLLLCIWQVDAGLKTGNS